MKISGINGNDVYAPKPMAKSSQTVQQLEQEKKNLQDEIKRIKENDKLQPDTKKKQLELLEKKLEKIEEAIQKALADAKEMPKSETISNKKKPEETATTDQRNSVFQETEEKRPKKHNGFSTTGRRLDLYI